MDTVTASAYLQRARAGIRQAMAEWDAAILDRVDNSRELLMAAVSDMRVFENAASHGEVPASDELCATIVAVKQEIMQATRVVDACVAFHRGLASRMGETGGGYGADGHIAGESGGMAPEVLA